MEWNDEYSVGVESLDTDHKMLMDLITQFQDSFAAGKSHEHLKIVFDVLMEYTINHFRNEEEYMEKSGFSGLKPHRLAHERLRSELQALYRSYQEGDETVLNDMVAFLNNWWQFHILNEDMAYKQEDANNAL